MPPPDPPPASRAGRSDLGRTVRRLKRRARGALWLGLGFAGALAAGAAGAQGAAASRETVRTTEKRLLELGFWAGPADGRWDEASRQALIAFQKLAGLKPTGRTDSATLSALFAATPWTPRETGAPHVEVDLLRQVLFLVDADGRVHHILPVSSGSGKPFRAGGWVADAVTPTGRFTVFRKLRGWHTSPLGSMRDPNFLVGGIAIHGSDSVPARPASHGCIRIPLFASGRFSDLAPVDTVVLVYD